MEAVIVGDDVAVRLRVLVPRVGPLGGRDQYSDEFGMRKQSMNSFGYQLAVKVSGALLKVVAS